MKGNKNQLAAMRASMVGVKKILELQVASDISTQINALDALINLQEEEEPLTMNPPPVNEPLASPPSVNEPLASGHHENLGNNDSPVRAARKSSVNEPLASGHHENLGNNDSPVRAARKSSVNEPLASGHHENLGNNDSPVRAARKSSVNEPLASGHHENLGNNDSPVRAARKSSVNEPLASGHHENLGNNDSPVRAARKSSVNEPLASGHHENLGNNDSPVRAARKSSVNEPLASGHHENLGNNDSPVRAARKSSPVKKRHRSRRKIAVDREIYECQESTELLIKSLPFQRVVRQIAEKLNADLRWQGEAILNLQHAAEDLLVDMFKDANLCARHAKRDTIRRDDICLARSIRRKY